MLVSCLAHSSTMKMEATYPSETLIDFKWTTLCYIPDEERFDIRLCFDTIQI
jgi:hypothetical protein